jgi:hypothetical protein
LKVLACHGQVTRPPSIDPSCNGPPVDHHVVAGGVDELGLALVELIVGEDRRPVLDRVLERRMVDPDAFAKRQVPAQKRRGHHHAGTGGGQADADRPAPGLPGDVGGCIECQCCGVADRVGARDGSLVLGAQVGELGQARDDRGKRRQHADADERVGSFPGSGSCEEVQHERARPGPDGDVGQHGVDRVTHPGTAHQILELPGLQHLGDEGTEGLGEGIQRPGLLDLADDAFPQIGAACSQRPFLAPVRSAPAPSHSVLVPAQ